MAEKITKDMIIGDIIRINPVTARIMFKYGLHCVGCHVASMESLEQGAKAHGLSDEQINKMVDEMNQVLEETEKTDESKEEKEK